MSGCHQMLLGLHIHRLHFHSMMRSVVLDCALKKISCHDEQNVAKSVICLHVGLFRYQSYVVSVVLMMLLMW